MTINPLDNLLQATSNDLLVAFGGLLDKCVLLLSHKV